jgi:hypothetical protein
MRTRGYERLWHLCGWDRGRVEDAIEQPGGQALGVDEGQGDEGGDHGEVDGQGEQRPLGSFAAPDSPGVEGCVFEHWLTSDYALGWSMPG